MSSISGLVDRTMARPVDNPTCDRPAMLVLHSFESAWTVYGVLADVKGHLPVRDRYHRTWILVEVAGRLRSRQSFARTSAHPGDSRDIHGLIDVDSRAVLHARDLIDAHGPLTVEPSPTAIPAPFLLPCIEHSGPCAITPPASLDATR
ncbi:hypothetical protein FFI94_032680 [Rhodococcus sp. KBS0724]|uniref:hypothetical protein n=1 Tax=Rhodococcus sp. KBS0724 TaxID=1179674 RepID=UPI00110E396C|nr:hypothetical protein [Rhodococcus sp. KBS0724]TSD40457.1 hypothetical protein FFI94_032680 [Rhodococcus sp. KBS0724]